MPRLNMLLGALTPDAFNRIAPDLTPVTLSARQVLYRPGEPVEQVYFPQTAVVCLLTVMRNGDTIETSTVGREGASWISASVGAPSMPCETIVAVGGRAVTLGIGALERELEENGHFHDVLTQYSHALLIASMRTSGCAGLHSVEQRCARWMLMTLDRVDTDHFLITHELLAAFLGARRSTVSEIVEGLAAEKILLIGRGHIRVANRAGLYARSCECYDVIKENYEQVGKRLPKARRVPEKT